MSTQRLHRLAAPGAIPQGSMYRLPLLQCIRSLLYIICIRGRGLGLARGLVRDLDRSLRIMKCITAHTGSIPARTMAMAISSIGVVLHNMADGRAMEYIPLRASTADLAMAITVGQPIIRILLTVVMEVTEVTTVTAVTAVITEALHTALPSISRGC